MPQGLIIDPLLLNIYLNDLFFFRDCNVWNFADDTAPYVIKASILFLNNFESNFHVAFDWSQSNYMKMSSDKCHLLGSVV